MTAGAQANLETCRVCVGYARPSLAFRSTNCQVHAAIMPKECDAE